MSPRRGSTKSNLLNAVTCLGPGANPRFTSTGFPWDRHKNVLGPDTRSALSQLARDSVLRAAEAGPGGRFQAPSLSDEVSSDAYEIGGAFVSLHEPDGGVRGCVGTTAAVKPLAEVIPEMARAAALRDPRFPPVTPAEVPELELEISVLGPLEPVDGLEDVEIGRHGLLVEGRGKRGLPERGWNGPETGVLGQCKQRTPLPPGRGWVRANVTWPPERDR